MIVCLQELVLGSSFCREWSYLSFVWWSNRLKFAFSMQSCCRWDRIHPITGIVSPVKSWDPQISRLPGANPSENRLVAVSDTQKTQVGDSGVFQVFWNFANQRFPTIRLKSLEEFKAWPDRHPFWGVTNLRTRIMVGFTAPEPLRARS